MAFVCFAILLAVCSVLATEVQREPVYKYSYQTDELMKTSASEVPVHGYHSVEGSYYPDKFGHRNGFDRYSDHGFGNRFGGHDFGFYPGYSNSFISSPYYGGHGFHHGGPGGGYVDKRFYNDENKKIEGDEFEKAHGEKGISADHGAEGYARGKVALKNEKGEAGSYKDEEGEKKSFDDEKSYHGGHHYDKSGENGEAQKQKANHRKGHQTKGFKTTHHKDESGKTETFYDEASDEGDNYNYGGNQGSFAEKEESSFKGGHENGQFAADEKRKQGHYDKHHVVDNANADKGQYGERGYHGNGQVYNYNNGVGQHSLLGRQEANREFYHHYPYGHRPFYTGY